MIPLIPELFLQDIKLESAKNRARSLKSWDLNRRQTCDLDLLLNGSFYPLTGFLTKQELSLIHI